MRFTGSAPPNLMYDLFYIMTLNPFLDDRPIYKGVGRAQCSTLSIKNFEFLVKKLHYSQGNVKSSDFRGKN